MTSDPEPGPGVGPVPPDEPARPDRSATGTDHPENPGGLLRHYSAQPPRWIPRALAMAVVAVFIGIFAWHALAALRSLGISLLIAAFIALALEPITVWLVRHNWRRGVAAFVALIGTVIVLLVITALFGSLFFSQLTSLVDAIPNAYTDLANWANSQFGVQLPAQDDLLDRAVQQYGQDVATQAIGIGSSILGGVFSSFTIMLVTYYLLAAGPRFRVAVCRWLTPNRQQEILQLWEITQVKVSDFINSRVVLAALNSFFTFVFLQIIGTPYSVPLALFCGVVSQFVPTIGTYIGGALPVVVALTAQGIGAAIAVLAFIIVYQQVENLYFSPKVSAKALQMNPAVSFIVVLGFGAVFGPLGAFLGLPVAATIQAIATTYMQRHELIESEMLRDPDGWRNVPSDGPEKPHRGWFSSWRRHRNKS